MIQFETNLDNLTELINRLNTELSIGLVYQGQNARVVVWSAGNHFVCAQTMDARLTELELFNFRRVSMDQVAKGAWERLYDELKRTDIPFSMTSSKRIAKKTIATLPPREFYFDPETEKAWKTEQYRRENMTNRQAAEEILWTEQTPAGMERAGSKEIKDAQTHVLDEVEIFLDRTNKDQFSDWLNFYFCKRRLEPPSYPWHKVKKVRFYYPYSILASNNQATIDVDKSIHDLTFLDRDIFSNKEPSYEDDELNIPWPKGNVGIIWMEVGDRLKLIVSHVYTRLSTYPLFDLLGELGKDWPGTQGDIWSYVQAQAKEYQVELPLLPFRIEEKLTEVDAEAKNIPDIEHELDNEKTTTISERTRALNNLAVQWVEYNQISRFSKSDGMTWFLGEYAPREGLPLVSVDEFKKYLPRARDAGIIDQDKKTKRYIPKLAT
jgi:hypothetical protein